MSEHFLSTLSYSSWDAFEKAFHEGDKSQLSSKISTFLNSNSTESQKIDFIRDAIQAVDQLSFKKIPFFNTICTECIKLIMRSIMDKSSSNLPDRFLKRITDIIINQIPRLDTIAANNICSIILEYFSHSGKLNQHACSIIPPLLNCLDNGREFSHLINSYDNHNSDKNKNIEVSDGDISTHSTENDDGNNAKANKLNLQKENLKNLWISSFCRIDWQNDSYSRISAMFVDVVIDKYQCDLITNKLLNHLLKLPLDELPSIVYQILLLSRNFKKTSIISSIILAFQNLEIAANASVDDVEEIQSISKKMFYQVEGTVLLHFLFCVQQDHEWGAQIFKYAKKGTTKRFGTYSTCIESLTTFFLATILNLSTIPKFKDLSFEHVKNLIMVYSRDVIRLDQNVYARELVIPVTENLINCINSIVSRSAYGWETTIQQLLATIIHTLDYAFGSSSRKLYGAEESKKAIEICGLIIQKILSSHKFIQQEIVQQTFTRLNEQRPSSSCLVKIICNTIQDHPSIAFNCEKCFSESLNCILNSTETDRQALVSSMSPLLKKNAGFYNNFVLMLRKILYSRSNIMKRISVLSIVDLIIMFAQFQDNHDLENNNLNNISINLQGSSSKKNAGPIDSSKNLILLELVSLLRRSFTHQYEIISLSLSKLSSVILVSEISNNCEFLETLCRIFHTE
ncbi:hypothetical protein BB561_005199, partial [Smittium simulii]